MITIGVVSRLEKIKGMDLVVPAFAHVHASNPETKLLVVGDGNLMKSMQEQAQQAGIEPAVKFVGRQPQDRLSEFYEEIDILLMPSRSEGFGLTAVEGMEHGCVPVVADTGGLPEVVRDGKDGLLHKPEDMDDLAAKVNRLIADPNLLERLSANALTRSRDFSAERYNSQIQAWYRELM